MTGILPCPEYRPPLGIHQHEESLFQDAVRLNRLPEGFQRLHVISGVEGPDHLAGDILQRGVGSVIGSAQDIGDSGEWDPPEQGIGHFRVTIQISPLRPLAGSVPHAGGNPDESRTVTHKDGGRSSHQFGDGID